jgi:hypothetical protein
VQIETLGGNCSSRKNQRVCIQSGMTTAVEIKLSHQTLPRYLTWPATKTLDESLRKR